MSQYTEKQIKAVVKEGGKRGVEIDGAATMGGLEFFCTKVDEPAGDLELMKYSLEGMNKEIDPNDEESKGGSGWIGKLIVSINDDQTALIAYVPEDKQAKVNAAEWLKDVLSVYDEAKFEESTAGLAKAIVPKNADKGTFSLKVRDDAISRGISYLRSKGAFPEAEDSDSEPAMGDDFFDNL
jgi:hypothetical protein